MNIDVISHPARSILDDAEEYDDIKQIDQKIQSIEEEMRRLADFLQRLRTRRNAKTLISRLPTEIMTHIFIYCVPTRSYRVSICTKWHSFTHVCHSWRSIALNHAPLWNFIDFSSMEFAQIMLVRSKTAILNIVIHHREENWREVLELIQPHFPRIGRIDVVGNDILVVAHSLIQPLPSLRSLAFTNFDNPDPAPLPDQFLAGNAPLLSDITLREVYLPWHTQLPMLRNLTSLVLNGNGLTNLPTGKQLSDTLRHMPRLEVLDLSGIFPISVTEIGIIPLPKLRQLDIRQNSEDLGTCTDFVEHLEFPEFTTLNIGHTHITSEDASIFNPLLSYLSQTFSKSKVKSSAAVESPRTIKALWFAFADFRSGFSIQLEAWNICAIPFECLQRHSILRLDLSWHCSTPSLRNPNSDFLKAVLRSLPMESIETFHIDYTSSSDRNSGSNVDGDPMDNLNKYLGPLPWSTNVKTLGIYGSSAFPKQLLSALLSSPESNSTIEMSGLAFPAIQTLVLLENCEGYGYPPGVGLESFARTLADALMSRMKSGHTLEKLIIKTDGHDDVITGETLAILKEVVEELEVEVFDWRRR